MSLEVKARAKATEVRKVAAALDVAVQMVATKAAVLREEEAVTVSMVAEAVGIQGMTQVDWTRRQNTHARNNWRLSSRVLCRT